MSIIRVGLGETKKFAEGYEAIFGKKSGQDKKTANTKGATSKKVVKKKSAAKKK